MIMQAHLCGAPAFFLHNFYKMNLEPCLLAIFARWNFLGSDN
jgi:hypothetical protein